MTSADEYEQILTRMRLAARLLRRSIAFDNGIPEAAVAYVDAVQTYRIAVFGRSQPPHRLDHLSDHDLERYHRGTVTNEAEMVRIEEHLLICPECIDQAEQVAEYVDAMRAAAMAMGSAPKARVCYRQQNG